MPVAVFLGAACLLTGCGQSKNTSTSANAPASSSPPPVPLNAPAGYVGAAVNAESKAIIVTDLASVRQAVQMFNASEGRYPKDLDELVQNKLLHAIPKTPSGMKIDYDPATGEVDMVSQ
jgi:hypothetical protein